MVGEDPSNPDFRVPRLHPIGERTLTGPCGGGKKGHLRGPKSRSGLPRRSCPSTFWSRCGPGLLHVHHSSGPGSRSFTRKHGILFLDVVSLST